MHSFRNSLKASHRQSVSVTISCCGNWLKFSEWHSTYQGDRVPNCCCEPGDVRTQRHILSGYQHSASLCIRSRARIDHRQLFPLMLRGLELPDLELRANITESLVMLIEGDGTSRVIDVITSHLGGLVPKLIRNTRVDRHARASVVSLNSAGRRL
jgi:hypothetical protein